MTVLACCIIQCNTCHQVASLVFRLHKIQFRPGLRPGSRWGSLRRSPRPSSRLGRGIPPPQSPPSRRLRRLAVDAFAVEPRCLRHRDPPTFETSLPWERAPQLFQTTLKHCLQRNTSFGVMPNRVHFCYRILCWKMTKYDVHILWLTVSVYDVFGRRSNRACLEDKRELLCAVLYKTVVHNDTHICDQFLHFWHVS